MKVWELIEKLEQMNTDLDVCFNESYGPTIVKVVSEETYGAHWIVGSDDYDLSDDDEKQVKIVQLG